jgi:hypothetical protein
MDERLPHERSNSFFPPFFFYFWSHFEAFFFKLAKFRPKDKLKIKYSFWTVFFHWKSFAKKRN